MSASNPHDDYGPRLAGLVEQLARGSASDAFQAGLNPAQWSALHYFARANRFSRTMSAFAAYHATTRGTASQTIRTLLKKGFVARHRLANDRRRFRLDVTRKGMTLLAGARRPVLCDAATAIPAACREQVVDALERMLSRLSRARLCPPFGVCPRCRHLDRQRCDGGGGRYLCTVAQEVLHEEELSRLCVDFEPIEQQSALAPAPGPPH